jgi:hypothetical protein
MFRLDLQAIFPLDILRLRGQLRFYIENEVLIVESFGVGCPEELSLVAELVVGVESSSKVGEKSSKKVVLEETMSFEESSELLKER